MSYQYNFKFSSTQNWDACKSFDDFTNLMSVSLKFNLKNPFTAVGREYIQDTGACENILAEDSMQYKNHLILLNESGLLTCESQTGLETIEADDDSQDLSSLSGGICYKNMAGNNNQYILKQREYLCAYVEKNKLEKILNMENCIIYICPFRCEDTMAIKKIIPIDNVNFDYPTIYFNSNDRKLLENNGYINLTREINNNNIRDFTNFFFDSGDWHSENLRCNGVNWTDIYHITIIASKYNTNNILEQLISMFIYNKK